MNYQLHYLIITNDPLDVIEEGEELLLDDRIEAGNNKHSDITCSESSIWERY